MGIETPGQRQILAVYQQYGIESAIPRHRKWLVGDMAYERMLCRYRKRFG